MAVQTINAEIHIRRGTYDQLRKVYDPQNPDQSLSEGHPFQVMPGELAIAQDTNTLFFRLDDGQDPDYTKANTTQRLIEMPFQANDLKVSDRNAVTAGWRKLGTHSGSMFCAILTVVAGDGLWRCFVHRSGNAASVMSLDADPNAKISALKYVDTADGGEIWANVAADCTMYAEVVDETTNRGGTSSGWSFDPDFEYSETAPVGVNVNATGIQAQSDTSACHAVLQKADGTIAASENEPFEAHGLIDDFDDAVLPGVYKAMDASNGPSGRGRGSVMVTRSKLVSGHSMIADKLIQLYMVGGVTVSGVDAESELWIRDGYASAGSYTWSAWQRIDCDRSRLLPAHGWYFVSSADEFHAALQDHAGAAFDGVKNIWVLKAFTLTPDLSGNLSLALDCDVNVYGANVVLRAHHIYSSDTALHTIRFFNRYIQFDGLGGNVNVSNVRVLIQRLLCPVEIPESVLSTGACVYYEVNYATMIDNDTGDHPLNTYNPPSQWLLKRWDNTASAGASTAQELFPMAMSTGVLDASEYVGKLICGRFVASVTGEYSRLGVFNISGTTGTFRLGVYDAATDALLAQTPSITPSSTPLQPGDFKVLWTATENPFTLVAGHEYYFAVAGFGNNLTVRLLMREISPGAHAYVSGAANLGGSTDNPLPDPKPVISLTTKQVWIACK